MKKPIKKPAKKKASKPTAVKQSAPRIPVPESLLREAADTTHRLFFLLRGMGCDLELLAPAYLGTAECLDSLARAVMVSNG